MRILDLPEDGTVTAFNYKEGTEILISHCKKNRFVTKGKKNKRKYYNVIMSMDIETSKLHNAGYLPKMPAQYEYFNYPFCWQCAIDDCYIEGREIDEFFEMCDAAAEKLDGKVVCFIHNIAFEYGNLTDYFVNGLFESIFLRSAAQPLYIRNGCVEYRCSAQLTHKSLAQIGSDIGYRKLNGDFDYSKLRDCKTPLTLIEENYRYRDVMILNKYIKKETLNYCMSLGKVPSPCFLPYTQTGYVRADMRKNFSDTSCGYMVLSNTALTERQYYDIRPAFFGGYVHANFRIIGKPIHDPLLHVDITSAYPWAMVTGLFPYTLTPALSLDVNLYLHNLERENFAQIADVELLDVELKKGYIPYIPYSGANNKVVGANVTAENGKVVYADYIHITVNEIDMRLIREAYHIKAMRINKLYTGIKKPLPYSVVSTILQYFKNKSVLKGTKDADELYNYMLSKQKINSCYGLSATALSNYEYTVDPVSLKTVSGDEPVYKEADVLPYQWAIYVTSIVRKTIYGTILYLTRSADKGNEYWYSDTDSIFCKDTEDIRRYVNEYNKSIIANLERLQNLYFDIIPENRKGEKQYLGTLTIEDDCEDCVEWCSIGAKRYYIKRKDGLVEITFSGLRATKIWKDENGIEHNGRNTQRLIDKYGTINKAFNAIKNGTVTLEYEEGTDKMSNYNVKAPFYSDDFGYRVSRPCTYTLYGQSTNLSLNESLSMFLTSELFVEVF